MSETSHGLESDLLSLVEGTHASAFDRADVHEDMKWFNDQKGFGFIQPDDGGKDGREPPASTSVVTNYGGCPVK